MKNRIYAAIDLKSFYASVECVERGLDPLTANLVVADVTRTEKTICLAVSPSLKSLGIPGRARLFEVNERVAEVNISRAEKAGINMFTKSSADAVQLSADPELKLDFIVAPPQMSLYMKVSSVIYNIYLKYISADDIHVYSIDEVFIDLTGYLELYHADAKTIVSNLVCEIFNETGITATAGIGTNLYLCKVAMDIVAKHMEPDENGLRIAALDEKTYRRTLWSHKPLTDFWRIGNGYAKKLERVGLDTMGEIAAFSLNNEDYLYRIFGINAELLIDHAWGAEPCTIADIKSYRPESRSLSNGQVLSKPYEFEDAALIVREMADILSLELVAKEVKTRQITIDVGYDTVNLRCSSIADNYYGEVVSDRYGRKIPKRAHGSSNFENYTSSAKEIISAASELFEKIADPMLLVRRITISANYILPERDIAESGICEQLDLFSAPAEQEKRNDEKRQREERENRRQKTILSLKERYGNNAVFRAMDLQKSATTLSRNKQIGGHKA